MEAGSMTYQVLLFYKYVTIENPQELADQFRARAKQLNLTGRVLIAEEGINATMEGVKENTEIFATEFLKDPRFSDVSIKRSAGTGNTFPKLSVKVRKEIVGTQLPTDVDPRIQTSRRLSPDQLHEWYESNKDFVVVDMRNSYEFESGHFRNSIDPGMQASRDLSHAVEKLEPIKDKTVVTVCTGGVRCEKMSAYLLAKGFSDVYQLEDGMHGYMEKYPGKNFLGTLYTFDGRVVMDFGGEREIIGTCRRCKAKTENYTNCAYDTCHLHFLACTECMGNNEKAYCSKECEKTDNEKIATPSPRAMKQAIITELKTIPGIGKSIAEDLYNIGIRSIADLKDRDPQELYDKSNERAGVIQDRCLLYTFRCAVYFASTKNPQRELLKWWSWKDK